MGKDLNDAPLGFGLSVSLWQGSKNLIKKKACTLEMLGLFCNIAENDEP